ncbi:hypothetical protein M433DRAFT_5160 [Acidomyces richmondensis BFW]|nr:MAG: hypothetical protein FE78DRAFT_32909 [Acidomyces sp. 'richmondensis']KYG44783.1 hypothetical protein M433DRAFT_5160 [Acidomyces richmondensis BFW]
MRMSISLSPPQPFPDTLVVAKCIQSQYIKQEFVDTASHYPTLVLDSEAVQPGLASVVHIGKFENDQLLKRYSISPECLDTASNKFDNSNNSTGSNGTFMRAQLLKIDGITCRMTEWEFWDGWEGAWQPRMKRRRLV